jgi:hypothetical protein
MADSDSDDSDIVIEELPSGAPPAAAADAESSDDDIVITGACPAPALFPPAPRARDARPPGPPRPSAQRWRT